MNKTYLLSALCLALPVLAQTSAPAVVAPKVEASALTQALDQPLGIVEKQFVSAAEAMPEDKYGFAPSQGEFKDARTFAQQVKHVAVANYGIGSFILGEKPPVDMSNMNGPDSVKSKAEIVKFLKDSYLYAHRALAAITEQNATTSEKSPFGAGTTTRLGMGTFLTAHAFDHYGQMAVYMRMNGIVPPASRKKD